jgi:hypothetical protein
MRAARAAIPIFAIAVKVRLSITTKFLLAKRFLMEVQKRIIPLIDDITILSYLDCSDN